MIVSSKQDFETAPIVTIELPEEDPQNVNTGWHANMDGGSLTNSNPLDEEK